VSNLDGNISSIVNANTGSGFSVVKYTGTGANTTVGHGLGAAPEVMFIKDLDNTRDWGVYHIGNTGSSGNANEERLKLNLNVATTTYAPYWNGTTPTSTVFSLGNEANVNTSGQRYIAYCWTPISGFSKFGNYGGNGGTQSITGLGFAPDWVLIKESSAAESWRVFDNLRGATKRLFPDTNGAESAASDSLTSFDSDGFSLGSSSGVNENGQTYIYMAYKQNATLSTEKENSFNITTYTGNATDNRSITGVGFRPDLVWTKERSSTSGHVLFDNIRGPGNQIITNLSDAETSGTNRLKSFNSDGFTLGTSGAQNANGDTYAS
jgi:hypothetical protein